MFTTLLRYGCLNRWCKVRVEVIHAKLTCYWVFGHKNLSNLEKSGICLQIENNIWNLELCLDIITNWIFLNLGNARIGKNCNNSMSKQFPEKVDYRWPKSY